MKRRIVLLCTCLIMAGVMLTACKSQTGNVNVPNGNEQSTDSNANVTAVPGSENVSNAEDTNGSTDTTTDAVKVTYKDYSELIKSYTAAIDTEYGYNLAYKLAYDETLGGECGFRTAGSDFEHLCADYLAEEMEKIGLTDVEKIPVTVDKWQFNSASLTIADTEINIVPASYAQTGTPAEGITAEIVNVYDGTMESYADLDVEGKIVLAAVDQRNVEWIDSYIQEAKLHGAVALVSYSVSGYAEFCDDDRNIQDVCCKDLLPTVSISRNEATAIIEAIGAGKNVCTLKVDNEVVKDGGTSYMVVGKLKGKSSEQQSIYSAHYDKYYYGFQDDCCAISLIFTIAKAMKDSGYEPENDILVVCHGAEEWGVIDCQHDWTTGAWQTINTVHPEWAKKTIAMYNFELPGVLDAGQTQAIIATVPEYADFVKKFVSENGATLNNNAYSEGICEEAVRVSTMEDGVSYRFAGVPYFLNGLDFTNQDSFAGQKYHTESDNKDTWNADVFAQNAMIFGAMGITNDLNPAMELNLTASVEWLKETLNTEYAAAAQYDLTNINTLIDEATVYTSELYNKAVELNKSYVAARTEGNEAEMTKLRAEGLELNRELLASFKTIQDYLVGLESSAEVVIRHEGYAHSLDVLYEAIACCENGDLFTEDETGALDILYNLNSGYAYCAYVFSPENAEMTYAMYARGDKDMFWGNSKVTEFADVDLAIRTLLFDENVEAGTELLKKAVDQMLKGYAEALTIEETGLRKLLNK